ncbi:MAG: PLDc N-terminal domain-containing protein, partial [Candidatus Cryptobacteroides sp.]|nr:PLDc N-terminal domain-containing protein [Bacteroidales bacterium]MDY6157854.1 PLDc N-terminal domain-containing protein [Candidatus Cryptobacteroides sp.]
MNVWLGVFFLIVLISTIVVLIAENRHPVRTLAWLLVLIFLPVVGLVLYFLFGMDKKHRRLITDADLRRLKKHTTDRYPDQICENPPAAQKDLMNLLRSANSSFPLNGNDVRTYTGFDSMFSDLLADLDSARDHIHFEFFKFEDDAVGRRVEEILTRKAKEGVEVRVQYDDAANLGHRGFFRRMKASGVMVQPFIK